MRNAFFSAVFVALCLLSVPTRADSIRFDGKSYDNVYIDEGRSMYYIQFPATGKVLSVRKDKVAASDIRLIEDEAARKALRDEWRANSGLDRKPAPTVLAQAPRAAVSAPQTTVPSETGGDRVSSGQVPQIRLNNVPLRSALKGILRPMNLDYKVENGYLWISRPDRIRLESFESPETRALELKSAGGETLPKIVVRNPGGAGTGGAGGNANALAGAAFGGGGMGTGGVGTGGFGGGGLGGFGGGGLGGGGLGGGLGGGGIGGGGVGGGFGGGGGGGVTFMNISELFSTIDDTTVGEPPAIIGGGGHILIGGGNANYRAWQGDFGDRP